MPRPRKLVSRERKHWLRKRVKEQKNRCAICGDLMRLRSDREPHKVADLDHVTPLSRGGPDEFWNTQATHRICNNAKGNRLMAELSAPNPLPRLEA